MKFELEICIAYTRFMYFLFLYVKTIQQDVQSQSILAKCCCEQTPSTLPSNAHAHSHRDWPELGDMR